MIHFKPIYKSFVLVIILAVGTYNAISKLNQSDEKIKAYVNDHLLVSIKYKPISNSKFREISNISKINDKLFKADYLRKRDTKCTRVFGAYQTCRINDTLYSIQIYSNQKDSIIGMGKPQVVNNF